MGVGTVNLFRVFVYASGLFWCRSTDTLATGQGESNDKIDGNRLWLAITVVVVRSCSPHRSQGGCMRSSRNVFRLAQSSASCTATATVEIARISMEHSTDSGRDSSYSCLGFFCGRSVRPTCWSGRTFAFTCRLALLGPPFTPHTFKIGSVSVII